MGSLSSVYGIQLIILSIITLLSTSVSFILSKRLNILLIGEIQAKMLGINLTRTRIIIFCLTGLLTGTVTAYCGPIGFIGIIVPHIARMLFSTSNHKILIPGCILIGSSLMLISDILSNNLSSDTILPINAVTALIGIPVVIWIIFRNHKISNFI